MARPDWLKEAIAEARKKRLENVTPEELAAVRNNPDHEVTQESLELGAAATGDPAIDRVLKQPGDTRAVIGKAGAVGKAAGEFGLGFAVGTPGDIATVATGIDPVTEERVGWGGRGVAVLGAALPGCERQSGSAES